MDVMILPLTQQFLHFFYKRCMSSGLMFTKTKNDVMLPKEWVFLLWVFSIHFFTYSYQLYPPSMHPRYWNQRWDSWERQRFPWKSPEAGPVQPRSDHCLLEGTTPQWPPVRAVRNLPRSSFWACDGGSWVSQYSFSGDNRPWRWWVSKLYFVLPLILDN